MVFKMKKEFVSIIIPFKSVEKELKECLEHCRKLDSQNFEIILLPDSKIKEKFPKARVFETGKVKPSVKRNLGIKKAKGSVLAFIDSDAYPARDWLSKALPLFKDEKVAIVGGPNITKPSDSLLEKASGEVFASFAGSGVFATRYEKGMVFEIDDLPSCNLLVRKKDLTENKLKFDEQLLTAEDSKMCFELKALGKKIVFSPEVIVYHHRRKLFIPHLKQVWNYGRDKALLLKENFSPKRIYYLLPLAIVLYTATGIIVSLFNDFLKFLFIATMIIYLLIAAFSSVLKNWNHSPLVFPGIVLTHYTYGIAFIYGLLKSKNS